MKITQEIVDLCKTIKPTYGYSDEEELLRTRYLLEEKGYEILGNGCYSIVFTHKGSKGGKVMKMTLSRVDGYHTYLKCIKEEVFPKKFKSYLPKIYKTKLINGIRVTILERLDHQPKNQETNTGISDRAFEMKEFLHTLAQKLNLVDDCGQHNVLFRRNTPVMVDPWSHRY